MSDQPQKGMTSASAFKLEMFIIGLGLLALVLIFQPFSITVFAIGSGLVVLAGLVNNLLPLARTGVPFRSVVTVGLVVAMIFSIVLVVAIAAAHLYGVFFLNAPDPNTTAGKVALATPVFYMQPFVWSLAAFAAIMALVIRQLGKK
jgi:hypothetical protein